MALEFQLKLCVTELHFPGEKLLTPKLGKWAQNGPKTGFFQFIGNFDH